VPLRRREPATGGVDALPWNVRLVDAGDVTAVRRPQPSSWMHVVSMDIEEFYDQDERRRSSEEVQFGRDWYENDLRFEVAWVADTGEVYAMAEPFSRRGISIESVTVEVLAVVESRDAIEAALTGWQNAMSQPNSLEWVRARVAGDPDPSR